MLPGTTSPVRYDDARAYLPGLDVTHLKSGLIALVAASPLLAIANPANVTFSSPDPQVARYDFVEITAAVQAPDAANPFQDATLTGVFETADGSHRRQL